VQELDDRRRRPDLDPFLHQRIRHAVDAIVVGYAVIDIHPAALSVDDLVTTNRERPHRGPVDRLEGRAAAPSSLWNGRGFSRWRSLAIAAFNSARLKNVR